MFKVPEKYRMTQGPIPAFNTTAANGNNGVFFVPMPNAIAKVIASDGMGWEHVSVSLSTGAMPGWDDMCRIKDFFWEEEDCVVQFHPPKSEYVNNSPNCLHLWRQVDFDFPRPHPSMVGILKKQ